MAIWPVFCAGPLPYTGLSPSGAGIVSRCDGNLEPLPRTQGLGLCLKGDFEYGSGEITMQPGDLLFLYTDGVTEASSDGGSSQFEEGRLANTLARASLSPAEAIRQVMRAIEAFTGGGMPADDITMLALRYDGILVLDSSGAR